MLAFVMLECRYGNFAVAGVITSSPAIQKSCGHNGGASGAAYDYLSGRLIKPLAELTFALAEIA
jgi:hypothetical protein